MAAKSNSRIRRIIFSLAIARLMGAQLGLLSPALTVAAAEPVGNVPPAIRFQVSEPSLKERKATPFHVLRVPDRVAPQPNVSAIATDQVPLRSSARIAQAPAATQPPAGQAESSSAPSKYLALTPTQDLAVDIRPSAGELPPNAAAAILGQQEPGNMTRGWNDVVFSWEAPGVCHRPVYFEQVNVERYGYTAGIFQPGVSAAHFFLTIPMVPYLVGAQPRRECVYTLGYYRPGSPVPYQRERLPISLRGVLFETVTVTGIVFFVTP